MRPGQPIEAKGCARPAYDLIWRLVTKHTVTERNMQLPPGTACSACGATDLPMWYSATYGTMCEALRSVAAKRAGTRNRLPDGSYPPSGATALAEGAALRASAVGAVLVANVPLVDACDVELRPAWEPVPGTMAASSRLVAQTLLDPPPAPFVLVRFGKRLPSLRITEDSNLVLLNDPGGATALERVRLLDARALLAGLGWTPGDLVAFQRWLSAWRNSASHPQQDRAALDLRERAGSDWGRLVRKVPGYDDPQAIWLRHLVKLHAEEHPVEGIHVT